MYSLPFFADNAVHINHPPQPPPSHGCGVASPPGVPPYSSSSYTTIMSNSQSTSGFGANAPTSGALGVTGQTASGANYGDMSVASLSHPSGNHSPVGENSGGKRVGGQTKNAQPFMQQSQYQAPPHLSYAISTPVSSGAYKSVSQGASQPVAPSSSLARVPSQPQPLLIHPAHALAGQTPHTTHPSMTQPRHQQQPSHMPSHQPQPQQQQSLLLCSSPLYGNASSASGTPPQVASQPPHSLPSSQGTPSSLIGQFTDPSLSSGYPPTAPPAGPAVSAGAWMMMPSQGTPQPLPVTRAAPASASPGSTTTTTTASGPTGMPPSTNPMLMMASPYVPSLTTPCAQPMMMMDMGRTGPAGASGVLFGEGSAGGVRASATPSTVGATTACVAPRQNALSRIERQQMELQKTLIRELISDLPVHQLLAYQPPSMQKNRGNAVLFVGQLNYDVTELDVRQMFSFYGTVQNVILFKDNRKNRRAEKVNNNQRSTSEIDRKTEDEKHVVGSSAFVTYATTQEADVAIMSLHGHYCMDTRDKPVQVSYCQKTDIISEYGYRHALKLHAENPANPLPSLPPVSESAAVVLQRLNAEAKADSTSHPSRQ